MRTVNCGVSGSNEIPETHKLSEIDVCEAVKNSLLKFYKKDLVLRPAQDYALFEKQILQIDKNIIIATPTNSGKSMLSYLLLLKDAVEGKTVVLIEPLRALALEKSEELKSIADILKRDFKIKIKITLSTGDYRITDEFMNSKPEECKAGTGQIIVATPERLDSLSRIPENKKWFEGISLVCLDEAHLIGDRSRGPVLELLIAYFKSLSISLRIVLMSATILNTNEIASWIGQCEVIEVGERYPALEKYVCCIEDSEDTNTVLIEQIKEILDEENTSIIVFVYQTASAESFANTIAKTLSGRRISKGDLSATMETGVAWFHANMSAATKANVLENVESGKVRITISTTALGMGINLPATHVFVRDLSFTGVRELDMSDLMQMIGRAGRGNKLGKGYICLSKSNLSKESMIVEGLSKEIVPKITSALVPVENESYYGNQIDMFQIERVSNQVMGAINRIRPVTHDDLTKYLQNSLCGDRFNNIAEILRYLEQWKLIYKDEITNEYSVTVLGQYASKCYLPPLTAANLGNFIRDLLYDENAGKHIQQMKPIDYLILLCLTNNEFKPIVRYGKMLETKINQYMEGLPLEEKSYLYRSWISTEPESVWGSARIDYSSDDAKKQVLVRTYTAMFLYDMQRGLSASQMKESYGVDVEEIQEKYRDNVIWLLSGMEQLLTIRSFYYHLKENCDADANQIHAVDVAFKQSSRLIFGLIGNLKFRSKLGEMLRAIKRIIPHAESYPGEGTLKKLEENGIHSIRDLVGKSSNDLVGYGIQRRYADMIIVYIRRRMA